MVHVVWHEGHAHRHRLDPQFNLTTLSGLALAIIVVLRIVDKGFIMRQPQCSWFVWVSRSVHQRTSATPYGDVNNPKNQEATKLNMAISILERIAFACGVLWLTEQPLSSVFFDTDEQKSLIDECEAKNSTLNLGPFGIALKSRSSWLAQYRGWTA